MSRHLFGNRRKPNTPNERGEVPINSLRIKQTGVTELGLELMLIERGLGSCRVRLPNGQEKRCSPATMVTPKKSFQPTLRF